MDLRVFNKTAGSAIDQYAPPRCFELSGERFELAMDDGHDYILNFIGKDKVEWNLKGEEPRQAEYMCLKADDTTYLVSYELTGTKLRENHTFVIDRENMLVTRIISVIGKNPKWPYLIKPAYEFGAIRADGGEVPVYPRHGYTSDMVGNVVQWTYGGEMATVHVYYCSDFYRITYPKALKTFSGGTTPGNTFSDIVKELPSSDEPTAYIKIKDGLYLFSLTESNAEKVLKGKMGFRSNTMCFLHNYKHCYAVGRTFGTITRPDGTDYALHKPIGCYAKILESTDELLQQMLHDPNPFLP
jgi:hypothetical protein